MDIANNELRKSKFTAKHSDLEKVIFPDGVELRARDIEILKLIAQGCSNKEIAENLYVSIHTVKSHIEKILDLLKAKNRSNLVFIAINRKIIGTEKV